MRFKPRLLEGINKNEAVHPAPTELLLDGQQRLTSLYQAIYSRDPVTTLNSRGKEVDRLYYIDIPRAIAAGADIRDALIGVPADRILRKNFGRDVEIDLSTSKNEFGRHAFPLNQVFPYPDDWFDDWEDYWEGQGKSVRDWKKVFKLEIVRRIQEYIIPVIRLDQENGREAICPIFEKVNTGGKSLDTFELLTAIYAADDFNLRDDWNGPINRSEPGREARIHGSPNRIDVLTGVSSIDFLQACALVHTWEEHTTKREEGIEDRLLPQVSCSRETLLALPLESYRKYADGVERGFGEVARFLHDHKIIAKKDVPYAPLLVALAATFAILERKGQIVSAVAKTKIKRWFWSVTLGEVYGSATDTLLARHVPELTRWISESGPAPSVLDEVTFQTERLRSLRGRYSAAYKAIHVLLMGYGDGCRDFVTGRTTGVMTFFDDRVDVHHVFPRAWCKANDIPKEVLNSIVNKTPLSAESNRFIGGTAPSIYLKRVEDKFNFTSEELDDILRSHFIEPEHLRNDDFEAFFNARLEALSNIVSEAMGKPVTNERGMNEVERETDQPAESNEDAEAVDLIDLIRDGESNVVEFKSTLRTNLHTKRTDKAIEGAVLKTLAGFLNTSGGTLVIGVRDDGEPVGIGADNFASTDKMSLHLANIVKQNLGPSAMTLMDTRFDDYKDSKVLVVDCQRSPKEVYLRDGTSQQFYIRTGPSTTELTGGDMVEYVGRRFV